MKNFVQPGDVVTLTSPAGGVLSGDPILVGSIFGVAAYDAVAGAEVEVAVVGVYELPKGAGAILQGASIYFDGDDNVVTGVSAEGLYPVGAATEAAGADAPIVRVRLNGVAVAAMPEA